MKIAILKARVCIDSLILQLNSYLTIFCNEMLVSDPIGLQFFASHLCQNVCRRKLCVIVQMNTNQSVVMTYVQFDAQILQLAP